MMNLDPWTVLWWVFLAILSWAITNEIREQINARRARDRILDDIKEIYPDSYSKVVLFKRFDRTWHIEIETYVDGKPDGPVVDDYRLWTP